MATSGFRVRDSLSHPEDTDFMVAAFDSCIPKCGGMWGTQPFSAKDGFVESTREDILAAERYRTTGTGEALRIFVAERVCGTLGTDANSTGEADADDGLCHGSLGEKALKVGAAMVRLNWFPGYIQRQTHFHSLIEEAKQKGKWLYIEVMISDFRAPDTSRKGVGTALLDHIREFARQQSAHKIFVDAWSGSGEKLVR